MELREHIIELYTSPESENGDCTYHENMENFVNVKEESLPLSFKDAKNTIPCSKIYLFPKDPYLKEKWITATGRINWMPSKSSCICSDHFAENEILITKKGYRYIDNNAVPTKKNMSYQDETMASFSKKRLLEKPGPSSEPSTKKACIKVDQLQKDSLKKNIMIYQDMEPASEIPMFIDVNRGPDYTELDKQNILASLLKAPRENDSVGQQTFTESESQSSAQQQPPPPETKQQKPRIKCPECHRFTTDCEERMVRHIRKIHRGQNPFQCTMCDYSTYNKSLFEEHVRIHKGIKPFKCAYCPYRSASKKNKNKHELIHRKNNPLKCDLCPFIAHHFRSLLCHKQKHENGELNEQNHKENENSELKCDVCLFKFTSFLKLQRHKSNNNSRVCEVCEYKFCSPYYLKKHMVAAHDVKSKHEQSFRCQVCGWMGALKVKILLHLIHHPNQMVDETVFDVSVLRKYGIMT